MQIPADCDAFMDLIWALFPHPERAGMAIRSLSLPTSGGGVGGPARQPVVTVVHPEGRISPDDLTHMVLDPLARGFNPASPEALRRSGCFPAPYLAVVDRGEALAQGLLAGRVAVHVAGHPQVLLVGLAGEVSPASTFSLNLQANVATLRRSLPRADLWVESLSPAGGPSPTSGMGATAGSGDTGPAGGPGGPGGTDGIDGIDPTGVASGAVAYLRREADPETVRAVRAWTRHLPWWGQRPAALFRLPQAVACASPAAVAQALQEGYIAVLMGYRADALLVPATLELLLRGPQDRVLPPVARRGARGVRLAAAGVGLLLNAGFVAVSSYHHSLLSGPFLMAIASGRQNQPLPIIGEVLLMQLLDDTLWSAAARSRHPHAALLALIGTALVATAALQAGVLASVPVVVGIASAAVLLLLPTAALQRAVRVWRYLFLTAGVALGIYALALLLFVLMVYLGVERAWGHPVRLPPTGRRQWGRG